MRNYNFYVYIITDCEKNVFYIGVTNDLRRRLSEHREKSGTQLSFAGKYYRHYLVYFEHFTYVEDAIRREKEIKKWRREKKIALIKTANPDLLFLNSKIE